MQLNAVTVAGSIDTYSLSRGVSEVAYGQQYDRQRLSCTPLRPQLILDHYALTSHKFPIKTHSKHILGNDSPRIRPCRYSLC